jgi:hypothetical protein
LHFLANINIIELGPIILNFPNVDDGYEGAALECYKILDESILSDADKKLDSKIFKADEYEPLLLDDLKKGKDSKHLFQKIDLPSQIHLEDGRYLLKIDGLEEGYYFFRFSDEAKKNIKWQTIAPFILKVDQDFIDQIKQIDFKVKENFILLKKRDIDQKDKILPGAVFELYKVVEGGDDIKLGLNKVSDGVYEYNENSKEYNLITDNNGEIKVTGLPDDGKYYFKEIEPPKGYDIIEGKDYTENLTNSSEVTVYNKSRKIKHKRKFKIVKVEKGNPARKLQGAVFILLKFNKSTGKYDKVTNPNGSGDYIIETGPDGEFVSDYLDKDGEYFLEEISPPDGYVATSDLIPVYLSENLDSGQINATMIENRKKPKKPGDKPKEYPKKDKEKPKKDKHRDRTTGGYDEDDYYYETGGGGRSRGAIVKTGDIRIFVLLGLGLVLILSGRKLLKEDQ